MTRDPNPLTLLITGSTGFLGHHVLAELLARRARCAVLLRPPANRSIGRLRGLLEPLALDLDRHVRDGSLVPVIGELSAEISLESRVWPDAILHCAASTRFDSDAAGEPARTNVEGTRRLLEWAAGRGVRNFHLVGTAFVCGRTHARAAERIGANPPDPHNAYEQSKWHAERLAARWAQSGASRQLTVHRPSVIVGQFGSGRASKFDGFYITARATELLSRRYDGRPDSDRMSIPLRIKGRPDDQQNIVPVDWVARMIGGIVVTPKLHGRVFHLVHPNAPTNALIKRSLEAHFRIGGGRFVDPEHYPTNGLNDEERLFAEIGQPIEHYVIDGPRFNRHNAREAELLLGVQCPDYDESALRRLVSFAQAAGWGRRRDLAQRPIADTAYARYFEQFLPRYVGSSRVARATAMSVTIRFIINDGGAGDYEWLCRFEAGNLVEVYRGRGGPREQFGYRSTADGFWRAISGQVHPQELFLSGDAEIFGDTERALKMIMILNAFSREFPCDRRTLEGSLYRRSA
jgi:nucleoside-diphosphate-sugar epimerase